MGPWRAWITRLAISAALVVTATSICAASAQAAVVFAPVVNYGVGDTPTAVLVADFNGDRTPDVASMNGDSLTVSVLLGNGDGTFQAAMTVAFPASPNWFAVGDFNGDGKPDLVVGLNNNTIQIGLGNGDGTFSAGQTIDVSDSTASGVVGDFNGDRKPDVALDIGNSVAVMLGNGDGTFQTPQTFGSVGAQGMAVGDFNRDGKLDVATCAGFNVHVFDGNGDGTFQAPTAAGVDPGPRSIAVGDFNRDGNLDLATANHGDGTLSVLLGNGDGSFQGQQVYGLGAQNAALSVVAADFDKDGALDLAVANFGGGSSATPGSVSVLAGNGDGTFGSAQNFSVGAQVLAAAAGDFNGDGKADIAATYEPSGGDLGVLINQTILPTKIAVHVSTTSVGAGSAFKVTAYAQDAGGHTLTSYSSHGAWSDLSGSLSPSAPANFVNGVSTTMASVTDPIRADGITVSSGGATGTSKAFNVTGPLDHITIMSVPAVPAGTMFTVRAFARDALNDTITSYNASATWSDLSGSLSPSTPANFVKGVSTTTTAFIADAMHADTITVNSGGATGTTTMFNVTGPLDHVTVVVPLNVVHGQMFAVKAYARDALNDTVTSYNGSGTWSDLTGTLAPAAPSNFVKGVSTTSAMVANPSTSDQITVNTSTVTGTSTPFKVK